MVLHIPEIEGRRVHVPGDRLAGYHYGSRQESAFVGDLYKRWSRRGRIGYAALSSISRPGRRKSRCR
ncbi:MAG: hypothetical protein OEW23_14760, partial [Candidatus Aminicenantes bacterium]|nr:hypothetical protein [Candidatus Aminicenantes bacterium]